jgi:predicted amidohydrolase
MPDYIWRVSTIRIALANLPYPADRDAAIEDSRAAIAEAGRQHTAILCFPECFVPGYRTRDRNIPPPDSGYLERGWDSIAAAAKAARVTVILGTERLVDGKARLTALVVNADGSRAGFQDKVQLDPSEESIYTAGEDRHVFETNGVRFGISICHEGWRYPETVRWPARRGAQIVFHPHFHEAEGGFHPTTFGDMRNTFHEKAMLCRAAENTVWFASANCAGVGSPSTSAVIRPDGTVLAWQPYGKAGLLVADLELDIATGLLASRCRAAE